MKNFQSIQISFHNAQNEELAARLELPDNPKAFIIFSPCFTCIKETLATYRISQQLASDQYAVLRIDFTGLGESEGDFSESNFSTQISDIIAANDYLTEHYQPASVLIGHSMGGTASYAAAMQLENIKAVVSIASPSAPIHVTHHFGDGLKNMQQGKAAEFKVAGKSYSLKPQFLDHLELSDLPESLSDLNRASLVFHGEKDIVVGIDHGYRLFENLPQPKSFISLDNADHVLSSRDDAKYVATLISDWLTRYI